MLPKTIPELNLGMQVGETNNYHHSGCNNRVTSKSLSVTRKQDGYLWHCFKCSASGFHRTVGFHPVQTLADKQASGRAKPVYPFPPAGGVSYSGMSALARDYLRMYFSDGELADHDCVEKVSGNERHLCFRTARGYQARSLTGTGPKWVSYGGSEDFYLRGRGDLVIITEDLISAALVSKHTAALATLGTHVKDSHLEIIKRFKYAAVWYDDDSSIVKRQQMQAHLKISAYMPCTVIHTGTDPKNIPELIPEVLQKTLEHFK